MRSVWRKHWPLLTLGCGLALVMTDAAAAQATAARPAPEKVIIDTDIGDDLDDALALGLALKSPELEIVGVNAAWGNTALRAHMLDRLLAEAGRADIRVAVGREQHKAGEGAFSQARWAERGPKRPHPDAVTFLLDAIRRYPGQITLIALAPETNLGDALRRDPETFRKLKRIVLMGGSVRVGYDDDFPLLPTKPEPEYNIAMDIPAAQAVFASGVPLYVLPLDSTQLKLDEGKRQLLFTQSDPVTDALALLYLQWSRGTKNVTPTMFDAVAVAYAIKPELCPMTPLHLVVTADGYTRETPGVPNAQVCLASDSDRFFEFYLGRFVGSQAGVGR